VVRDAGKQGMHTHVGSGIELDDFVGRHGIEDMDPVGNPSFSASCLSSLTIGAQTCGTQTVRRDELEALRRDQQRSERRRTLLFVGIAAAVGLGLIAAAAVPLIRGWLDDPVRRDWSDFGVSASAASCDEVAAEAQTGTADHRPDGERIDYASAPPTSGPHYPVPAPFTRKFYTPEQPGDRAAGAQSGARLHDPLVGPGRSGCPPGDPAGPRDPGDRKRGCR
jgi:hypothetical protein